MKFIKKLFSNMEANIISFTMLILLVFSIMVSVSGYGSFTTAFELEYDTTTYHMADTAAAISKFLKLDIVVELKCKK